MSSVLINHSPDLTRLRNEGYDSHAERSFYSNLATRGVSFYRALDKMQDFSVLAASVQLFDLAEGRAWPFYCDGLQFWPEYAVISELCGFRPGTNPGYDKLFERKDVVWPEFCAPSQGRLHYMKYNAWELPEYVTKKWIPVGMQRILLPQPAPRVLDL